ncbi:MAG: cation diffusion facilitator family transporter [Sciscionella sp.]
MAADTDKQAEPDTEERGGESTLTVLLALGANLAIAILKAIAGVISGSAAMLSEAAHSVADTFTELFLLTALRRSARPADRRHPFGYGKERYFWSLLAAVSIFTSGAVFAFVEGFRSLLGEPEAQGEVLIAYLVLAAAFLLESVSWAQALRQVRGEAKEEQRSFRTHLRLMDDPAPKTVLYEDSAALIGILLAFGGIGLHQLTGSAVFDGVASLLIGVLLAGVAYILGYTNRGLLIGRQADLRLVRAMRQRLNDTPEVETVVDILTMLTGADSVLLCARLDFNDSLTAAELELACVRIDAELREEFPDLDEIFLEPVPRTDPELRAKVLERYGNIG